MGGRYTVDVSGLKSILILFSYHIIPLINKFKGNIWKESLGSRKMVNRN